MVQEEAVQVRITDQAVRAVRAVSQAVLLARAALLAAQALGMAIRVPASVAATQRLPKLQNQLAL